MPKRTTKPAPRVRVKDNGNASMADEIARRMPSSDALDRLARQAGEGPKPPKHDTSLGFGRKT